MQRHLGHLGVEPFLKLETGLTLYFNMSGLEAFSMAVLDLFARKAETGPAPLCCFLIAPAATTIHLVDIVVGAVCRAGNYGAKFAGPELVFGDSTNRWSQMVVSRQLLA